jgi:hypothetical protein
MVNASSASTERDERQVVFSAAREAFQHERFAELNDMSRLYRVKKSRTPSGVWKLSWFYMGISNAIQSQIQSQSADREIVFRELEDKIGKWIRKDPKAPAARIAHGKMLVARAWAYRGHGNGNTVTSENATKFYEYLKRARISLEVGKWVAAVDPEWYVTMLAVATGENWDRSRFDDLVAEALKREPLYYGTYFEAAENLLPRWHGSVQALDAFARAAADRTSASEGQSLYARIYWNASQTMFEDRLFDASAADWPRMKQGFDDVIARYPDAWNLNSYARFACLAGDKATTRALLRRIGPDIDLVAWNPMSSQARCTEWALREE